MADMADERERPHVLVVNDIPEMLALFQELLGEAGYRVTLDRFTVEADLMLAHAKEAGPTWSSSTSSSAARERAGSSSRC